MNLCELQIELREKCGKEWLTPSQCSALDQILDLYSVHPVVNLYGPPGTGKSFLGWVMEKERYGLYLAGLTPQASHSARAILDNQAPDRRRMRRVREDLKELGVEHVIVITRGRVDDHVPAVELDITVEDVKHCRGNLYRHLGLHGRDVSSCSNLHQLMLMYVSEE